jgi:16S rRNA (guanine(966)-N(2))-methyltransferase RsmD
MDVRPTTSMVKESVFNIIQFDLPCAKVLDLFCGSGQMGIEALSRGADFCVFVDSSTVSLDCTKENLKHTGLFQKSRVAAMDSIAFLKTTKDRFDIAFLDPPYQKGLLQQALPLLAEKMSDHGIIICEHPREEQLEDQFGDFVRCKDYRYGKIMLTTYKKPQPEEV